MIFGAVFAGGMGSRMGNTETPKQFLDLCGKPVIIHTIEKFINHKEIDKLIVLTPSDWCDYTSDIIKKFFGENKKIAVIAGGETRNDTLKNALVYITETYGEDEESVIITHDAVRPFINDRIISENIKYAQDFGACDTVVPATDTIVRSDDNKAITTIPDRSKMYQGQTPQSFKVAELLKVCNSMTPEEEATLTDACKIYIIKNKPVYLVMGEVSNIKITFPYDLLVAETIIKSGK